MIPLSTTISPKEAAALRLGSEARLGADAQGWRREMEKAQTDAWFRGSPGQAAATKGSQTRLTGGGLGAADSSLPDPSGGCFEVTDATQGPMCDTHGHAGGGRLVARPLAGHGSPCEQSPDAAAALAAARQQASGGTAATPPPQAERTITAIAPGRPAGCAEPAVRQLSMQPTVAPGARTHVEAVPVRLAESPDLRVHVEHSDRGLSVWVGIDGDEAAITERAAALLAELRREELGGRHRLAALVCNGRTLYAAMPDTPFHPMHRKEQP